MKVIGIILFIVIALFIASQVWAQSQVSDIEDYPYSVTETYNGFEVRTYEEANFIYATMDKDNYDKNSGKGFNILAGYIFGGNESQQKIAMTSPVEMEMGETVTMKFLIPAQYDISEMPKPDNVEVKFKTEKKRRLAAIQFSGFANDDKINSYKDQLFAALAKEGISHTGNWSFMGYDPPFKVLGRRNEVVVELD